MRTELEMFGLVLNPRNVDILSKYTPYILGYTPCYCMGMYPVINADPNGRAIRCNGD